jgi:hypothetical protein
MADTIQDLKVKLELATKSLERAQRITAERAGNNARGLTNSELDAIANIQLRETLDKVVELSERYCKAMAEQPDGN